ncbi:Uncharacterised protein [Actinomyces howellii]|uniref:DUF6571 domain-containing protein n=2 Tax=Actinomyces howellii TaxID=52771 RepID=A0A448HHZ9_9ACTO|nr:Uncharacterised protein [Actinomyces howellii]
MTYVSLDPDGMQTIIDNLKHYAERVETKRSGVMSVSLREGHPADLAGFNSTLTDNSLLLEGEANDLQLRLDAARAANESGLMFTQPDGTIQYYVPDGMEDTLEVVRQHNNIDIVNQARSDAQTMLDYSQNGCSPEEWDALLERMRQNRDDPAYANAVLANVPPDEMLDCPAELQDGLTYTNHREGTSTSERPNAGEDLCGLLGEMLSTASCRWPDSKAKEYAGKLADATEAKGKSGRLDVLNAILMSSREIDVDGDGVPNSVGLDYSDAMLVELARRMENYSPQERDWMNPGDWGPAIVEASSSGSHTSLSGYRHDPLAGIVHAMTGNPEAGLEWLVPEPGGGGTPQALSSEDSVNTDRRIQELVNRGSLDDQRWTADWALLAHEIDSQDWVTPVPGAMTRAERRYEDSASATAVAGILNGLGSGADPTDLSDEARVLVGTTLARHPESVVMSTKADNPESPVLETRQGDDPDAYAYDPLFTDRALSNLAGQTSLNQTASVRLGEAMADHHQAQIDVGVDQYRNTGDAASLNAAMADQSRTNGFFAGAASRYGVESAGEADRNAESGNNTLSFVAGLIPYAGPMASYLVGEGKPFDVSNEDAARTEANEIKAQASGLNSDQLTLALLNSGLYSEDELKAAAARAGNGTDVQRVIGEDGRPVTDGLSEAEAEGTGFRNGLGLVGAELPAVGGTPGETMAEWANGDFNDGYERAYSTGGGDPAHEWGSKEE